MKNPTMQRVHQTVFRQLDLPKHMLLEQNQFIHVISKGIKFKGFQFIYDLKILNMNA